MNVLEFILVMGSPLYLCIGVPCLVEWFAERGK